MGCPCRRDGAGPPRKSRAAEQKPRSGYEGTEGMPLRLAHTLNARVMPVLSERVFRFAQMPESTVRPATSSLLTLQARGSCRCSASKLLGSPR